MKDLQAGKDRYCFMKNGFIKVAAATPKIRVADPLYNVSQLIALAKEAYQAQVRVLVFPELCITGCTCGDLFFSDTLLSGATAALGQYLEETQAFDMISVVGLPIAVRGRIYNCGAVCHAGQLLGIVPKQNLSFAGGAFDARQFSSADTSTETSLNLFGYEAAFGNDLLFTCREMPSLTVGVEIGKDMESLISPSSYLANAGATLICNAGASYEAVGAAAYRKQTLVSLSARTQTGYLYAGAGSGESTTDMVFAGHKLILENGALLAESKLFDESSSLLISEIDTERLMYERRCERKENGSFPEPYRTISFSLALRKTRLTRAIDPHPFTPSDPIEMAARCETILAIQTNGLKQRIERAFAKKIVIGISGGLDSTLALLVMARAMDSLERPRKDILAVTMPCFGTTKRTKNNATVLCEELGVDFRCVDIFDAVNQHFKDIGHDPLDRNVTYENSQARERTQILMDIANDCGGMVIGTGDLSELALGWATYNGDHMSMYGVNAAIPKTLIRHLVAHCADRFEADGKPKIANALRDVLNTPVSPELLPATESGEIAQKTEDLVGPYEIHDFYLYYMLRYGFSPSKLYRMALYALGDVYDQETLLKWLKVFIRRFFNQQFKRSCLPDGPKVGSVGLSPRGDWAMPSDASSALWLAEAEAL